LPESRQPEEWRNATQAVKEAIRLFSQSEQPILLVAGSSGDQVHPDTTFGNELAASLEVNDLLEPNRLLESWATEFRLPYIDLVSVLRESAVKSRLGVHGTAPNWGGHWNIRGHQIVGEALTHSVCELARKSMDKVGAEAS